MDHVQLILEVIRERRNALKTATAISTAGALLTFMLIQILDAYDVW